jgi:hypothetical protein
MPIASRKPITFYATPADDPGSAEFYIDHYESGMVGLSVREPRPHDADNAFVDICPSVSKEQATHLLAKIASAVHLKNMCVVDATALHSLLTALHGYGHQIRELQVIAQTPKIIRGEFDPIGQLTDAYNAFATATQTDPLITEIPK